MHGECYRKGNGQPYTRKQYIKGKPQIKIAKFQSGSADRLQNYDYSVQLLINEKIQITHMAIEATRLAANKTLEKTTGESGYFSKLRIYPHVLLRENKMIAAAGADRLQEGMRHLEAAKNALKGACVKLPGTPSIKVVPITKKKN
jgi:large subunit ribosomal protein L10e